MFLGIFFGKYLEGNEKCRTFAPAFAQKRQQTKELLDQREKDEFTWISESRKKSRPKGIKEFFERFTQTEVVQEASAFLGTWVKETNRFNSLKVAQAAFMIFLNLDSRSETEKRSEIIQGPQERGKRKPAFYSE